MQTDEALHEEDQEEIRRWETQLRKGSLDLAILASLWDEPLYGLEILKRLADGSSLAVPEGTIYPLLARLKNDGLVEAQWITAPAGHARKYFSLTQAGRHRARLMARAWTGFVQSLDRLAAPLLSEAK
jgi:PadR family transcriptional regulator, regulatory protein PadR